MWKQGVRVTSLAAVLALAACASGTPECGSDAVKADLKKIAEQRIAQAMTQEMSLSPETHALLGSAIAARLTYDFTSIRTTGRNESLDTYTCESNLVVTVKGINRNWTHDFEYEVSPVEEANANYEVRYDRSGLGPLAFGALGLLNQLNLEADNEVNGPRILQSLQEVRDQGGAGSYREGALLESLKVRGLEAPAATQAHQQLALEAMRQMEDPGSVYRNVPQDILQAAQARQQAAFEGEQCVKDEEEQARREACAQSPDPAFDRNCM